MTMSNDHQGRVSTDVDWIGRALDPLREGKPVCIRMLTEHARGKRKDPLITIVPGESFGFRMKSVVVSVINNGSCIVEIDCNSTANLVLAGIPAKLAKFLLTALQSKLREVKHGNSTTTRPKRGTIAQRAARWTSTRKSTITTIRPDRWRSID